METPVRTGPYRGVAACRRPASGQCDAQGRCRVAGPISDAPRPGCRCVARDPQRRDLRRRHARPGNFLHRHPPPLCGRKKRPFSGAGCRHQLHQHSRTLPSMLNTEEKTQAVVSALEDVKALDITVIDTSKLSPLFERMVVASAQSTRQTKALASSVVVKLKALGETVNSTEGEDSGEWVLVDLGEVVVHIMQPAVRAYYNLEELWSVHPKQRAISGK